MALATRLLAGMMLAGSALTGCDTIKNFTTQEEPEEVQLPPDVMYRQGIRDLKRQKFSTATKQFQEIDQKHPFSPEATRAQLNIIYSHYRKKEFDETDSAAKRFIRLHPRHEYASYAYYMRGMAHFQRIADAHRDQDHTREALGAFKEVSTRYPNSDYAWRAEQMVLLCHDRVAEQEVVVGRYYLDREEYIPALRRFKKVVENPDFAKTPYVEEALFSGVLASQKLGLRQEARHYASVLGHNFPKGAFYPWAVDILEHDAEISAGELKQLRRGVDEGSLVRRFFEGLKPGMPAGFGGTGG